MIRYEDISRSFNVTSSFFDRNTGEQQGDRAALCCDDESTTYSELSRLTNRIGNVYSTPASARRTACCSRSPTGSS